jgi:hypothetical protein
MVNEVHFSIHRCRTTLIIGAERMLCEYEKPFRLKQARPRPQLYSEERKPIIIQNEVNELAARRS